MPGPISRRAWLQGAARSLVAVAAAPLGAGPALADDNVELSALNLRRIEGDLTLEYALRARLTRVMVDALQRGMPLYFVARATLRERRWYWRDRRIARAERSWRVAYQPLTSTWRVSQGVLSQTVNSLSEAMALASAAGRWPIAELTRLSDGADHYVEFSWGLDTSQLPSPMRLELPGNDDWRLGLERQIPVPSARP